MKLIPAHPAAARTSQPSRRDGRLVHPADQRDRANAPRLLLTLALTRQRLEVIWADNASRGPLPTRVWETLGWRLRSVVRPGGRDGWMRADQDPPARLPGFQLLPRRSAVERSFAWFGRNRRMSKDYAFLLATSEAWMYLNLAQ